MGDDANVRPSVSDQRTASGPEILVDTNVWSYIVDLDALETLNRAARDGYGQILACPAVLYEMLRLEDAPRRHRLIKAICRSRWSRLMPEAFEESADLQQEISRLRPHWIRSSPDLTTFHRLYNDWHGPRGVWWRARSDPSEAAAVLRIVEGDHLTHARGEAEDLRTQIAKITSFENIRLNRLTTTFPLKPEGWDGNPVEAWRANTMAYYFDTLINPRTAQSWAPREWLEPWIDLTAVRRDMPSFARLFLYETDASHLPRSWLRWALKTLQATRKTGPGTPVDNQIGSYLIDADFLVTGDKVFDAIVRRVAGESVAPVARSLLVASSNCISVLEGLLV
jgi:hypothetical protein